MFLLSQLLLTACFKDEIPYGAELRDERIEKPSESSYLLNGYEYVDLGLPSGLKWATCNVGAEFPEEYGAYYAWGEINIKSEYTEANSRTFGLSESDISGNPIYDVARVEWGASWRLPTNAEFEELITSCEWEWIVQGGKGGYKVSGPNGKTLFLPAGGYRYDKYMYDKGCSGYYWSSVAEDSDVYSAYYLFLDSTCHYVDFYYRYAGKNIRPVSE
ncbi:MAG: hypothetical protein J6U51_09115 [Bacteroidales bacterium]|nr:hypothetical protein [Bacteroidales bacterium]